MNVEYIIQPDYQLGKILSELLGKTPRRVVFVSAFVSLQTILRIKEQVAYLKRAGSEIRFVLGIDLWGTSQEALEEFLRWRIDVRIVKHGLSRHTFHPKLYLLEWDNKAEIIIGSNNITEGGFFGNYEGAARVTYEFPVDSAEFEAARARLKRFISPVGPIVYDLTAAFLKKLVKRREVPTEAEAREARDFSRKLGKIKPSTAGKEDLLFGVEFIEPPPPLPPDLLVRLIKDIRRRRKESKKTRIGATKKGVSAVRPPIDDKPIDLLRPAAFYMTLPKLQGKNIPGEARIPLEAIELAKQFWGWPSEYTRDVGPRAGKNVYWNWRPIWRVWSTETPAAVAVQEVRMYLYVNSLDFRFYVRSLVNAGGDSGDVVRIRRVAEPDAEYECILARQGTPEYDNWIKYCTQAVQNSTRRFGYA